MRVMISYTLMFFDDSLSSTPRQINVHIPTGRRPIARCFDSNMPINMCLRKDVSLFRMDINFSATSFYDVPLIEWAHCLKQHLTRHVWMGYDVCCSSWQPDLWPWICFCHAFELLCYTIDTLINNHTQSSYAYNPSIPWSLGYGL